MSVTALIEPASVVTTTVAPPTVNGFPLTSTSCTVAVDVLVPSAVILEGVALIVEVPAFAAPATKSTVAVSPPGAPSTVNPRVAVPAVVEDVNVAV